MQNKSEVYSKSRRSTILGFVIGFGFWWGSKTLLTFFPQLHDFKILNNILVNHTGQPFEKVQADTERDYFMSSKEAKDYGLVDEVIMTVKETKVDDSD